MSSKIKYLFRSAFHYFSPIACPNCGERSIVKVDQKYIVTRLFECRLCYLQFRHPSDSVFFSEKFYQSDYVQDDGITTDLPDTQTLKQMLSTNFSGSAKNADHVVDLWKSIFRDVQTISAIDYGSSWGYMSYQFLKKGIQTQSFEISRPRAAFGNKHLGLSIKSNTNDLQPGNDLFYSSHVIEHVPSITDMVNTGKRLLKPEGVFVAECPNGSVAFRKQNENAFHQGWGLVHPNYLSDKFYQKLFGKNPYFITSAPFDLDAIRKWDGVSQVTHDTAGGQLLIIAKPNVSLK